jgi:general secretion pathway protein E
MGIRRVARVSFEDNSPSLADKAKSTGLQYRNDIDIEKIDVEFIRPLSIGLVREQMALPLWMKDGQLEVAIGDSSQFQLLDEYRIFFGKPIRPILVDSDKLPGWINQTFDRAQQSATALMEEMERDGEVEKDNEIFIGEDLLDNPQAAPIVRFVNSLLSQAIKQKASDIHIEPFEKDLSVRMRVDGVLQNEVQPPSNWKGQLVSRIKVMAYLDIAKKNVPQDGRITTRMAGRVIDIRVSTMPVKHGERVVMRILEKQTNFSLDGVGMMPDTLSEFRQIIKIPYGIILVCGPTGSGKTTTLYSALSEINSPDKNILTIEDPIEYELRGIGQTQVNHKIGLNFARVVRAHLRQDPDVILIGETRDKETAENAIQASLTGHLVFSTIHTNDSPTAFTRLIDMGIEPFLVATSLTAILAQRLVRRLCPSCKIPYEPSASELQKMDVASNMDLFSGVLYRAKGCPECSNKGYSGRMGIYELMIVDEEIRRVVAQGQDAAAIMQLCVAKGMRTLRGDGMLKVLQGHTSLDEIFRVASGS